MTAEERISQLVHTSIDTTMQSFDELMPTLLNAGDSLSQCLLNDGKILCCGEGNSGLLAQLFCTQLLNRCQQERPGLPALSLCSDAATLTAIGNDTSFNDIFSKQIRALAQPGDTVLVVNSGRHFGSCLQAIQAAHDRQASVLVLTDNDSDDLSALLLPEDIVLTILSSDCNRVLETQCIMLNCLCELIDQQLFGTEE